MKAQQTQKLDPQNDTRDEPYDEEKDPATPYLNPGYRVDLYENSWKNILWITLALIALFAGVFGYFMIFFGPITAGVMYYKGMWIAFLIIFVLTLAVCFFWFFLLR